MKPYADTNAPIKISKYFSSLTKDYIEVIELENGEKILKNDFVDSIYGIHPIALDRAVKYSGLGEMDNILLLGLGDGSIIHMLRYLFNFQGHILVLENDQTLTEVVSKEFGLEHDVNVKIIHGDIDTVLPALNIKNDFVIINLPEVYLPNTNTLYSENFWNQISRTLSEKGALLFNTNLLYAKETNGIVTQMFRMEFALEIIETQGFQDIYVWKKQRKQKKLKKYSF